MEDEAERLSRLSGLGDQLEAFSQTVDFEVFRPDLELALAYSDESKEGFVSKVHREKPHLKPMPQHIQKSSAGKSVSRSRVEHVFADQKS